MNKTDKKREEKLKYQVFMQLRMIRTNTRDERKEN